MTDGIGDARTDVEARATAPGPLAGIRIVEFVGLGPGPFAAMLLADLGAEVIRLDRQGSPGVDAGAVVSRGRPTVEVDLKAKGAAAGVMRLLAGADALIEGFRPGVMERLGLGPDPVLAAHPRLVYGRMTGWGQTGPLAAAAGHDINYIAITGALAAIGPRDRPVAPLNLVGDYGGGALYLVMGLLAGLLSARTTGRGQVVDCAICDGTASLMALFCQMNAAGRWGPERETNMLDGGAPYYRTFACADDQHVAIGALEPQFYRVLCERIGIEEPLFETRTRPAAWAELHERFAAIFRTRTRAEWCAILEGTDACFAPIMGLAEAPAHPHLAARGTFIEQDGVVQPAAAPRFSQTPSRARPFDPRRLSLDEAVEGWAR